jgi:hypothetical protein
MAREPKVQYEPSTPSLAEREEVGLTPSEARRLMAICAELIDLCMKVTGRIDPAVSSIVGHARDEPLSAALKN